MSIILNALRSQKEESPDKAAPEGEGVFVRSGGGGDNPSGDSKRTWVLIGILGVAILLAVGSWMWERATIEQSHPAPIPPPAPSLPSAAPASPAPPSTAPVESAPATTPAAVGPSAESLFQSGDYDGAMGAYQKAIEQDPKNAGLHNDLGMVFLKKGLYTSAETQFAKSLELDDKCAECYNNFGYLKTKLDQSVEAEKYLQKAIELNANYPDPYFNLGVLYEKNADLGKAVKAYQDYLSHLPKTETEMAKKVRQHLADIGGK